MIEQFKQVPDFHLANTLLRFRESLPDKSPPCNLMDLLNCRRLVAGLIDAICFQNDHKLP